MKRKNDKLSVFEWIMLAVLGLLGLLWVLSRFTDAGANLLSGLRKLCGKAGSAFLAVVFLLFSLLSGVGQGGGYATLKDYPAAIWVCDETGLTLDTRNNREQYLDIEYGEETRRAQLKMSRSSGEFSLQLLDESGNVSSKDVLMKGSFVVRETEFVLTVEYDTLYNGQYETLHFYPITE